MAGNNVLILENQETTRWRIGLRQLRDEHGMSQRAFAKLCGLAPTDINMIERGGRVISITNLRRFAVAFGVSSTANMIADLDAAANRRVTAG